MTSGQPNGVLAALLTELDWSPRALARRINRHYGAGTVAETAPYHWRDAGRVPRTPVPSYVAGVLARELGRPVTVAELWQGNASESAVSTTADQAMHQPWSRAGALAVLDDWLVSGLVDRRQFLAVTGATLTAMISGYTPDGIGRLVAALNGGRVVDPLLEQIEQGIPLLQRLDDATGGGTHLTYIGTQFRAVTLVLRRGGHSAKVEARLFVALAELGQLAGWMAFDAGGHGLAQRYFFTALRAANEAGYRSMAAHVLADLAFQAATCERPTDAVTLGETALRASTNAPATVRASVLSRAAYGYAIADRTTEFERAYRDGLEVLDRRGEDEPAWMYFLTANHLDAQAGYALVHAGILALDHGDSARAGSLLRQGHRLLRTGVHDTPLTDETQQRRAMFEGAWLAVAAAGRGDLEQACIEGRHALARTTSVESSRSMDVLRALHVRLRHRHQNEHVADFLPVLDAATSGSAFPRS
ncbi:MAG: transcriptional regulator [Streptosporangiales bacterium]|nr:transcriptional regulator [Streptosporangiales bacterium]